MEVESNRFLRYGGAEKCSSQMTKDELETATNNILRRAKEKAFWRGRPIIYGEDGRVFQEWPDGRIVDITNKTLIMPNED